MHSSKNRNRKWLLLPKINNPSGKTGWVYFMPSKRILSPVVLERRAKREERREKQRAANIGRAEKMHIARMEAGYFIPPDQGLPKYIIGCSGWFYWHWRRLFYPEALPTSDWFGYYASKFRTVELNAPFYSWPTIGTVNTWLKQVGRKQFVYTVKVSELITHIKRFTGTKILVQDFGYIADMLGPRMGCFLFQLPPSYNYTPSRLKAITSQLDPRRRNVVEFRHKSWWNETVYATFRKHGIIFCSCSGPRLPDTLIKTADEIYIRFHGTKQWYRHDYSDEELAAWAVQANESGAKRIWAYFNNDRNGYAIKNARKFEKLLLSKSSSRSSKQMS